MKFTHPDHHPRRGATRAPDVLLTPEQPAEGFFDIRQFLQSNEVRFMRMMTSVVNPQPDDHELFTKLAWVSSLDLEIKENLKQSHGFREYILTEFATAYQQVVEWDNFGGINSDYYIALAQAYAVLFEGMQVFPDLREDTQTQEKLQADYPGILKAVSDPKITFDYKIPAVTIISTLLPEHKTELITTLLQPYDGNVEQYLADLPLEEADAVALTFGIILFPQQADQIKQLARPFEPALAQQWETSSKKQKTNLELGEYFSGALLLSLLATEKVSLSPEGQLKFELKPAPEAPPAPLPARLLT